MRWVVKATPKQLHSLKKKSTNFIGGWVVPRTGMDVFGKCRTYKYMQCMYLQFVN